MPDTPELFEPNPLLSKFMYPMDTPLSESCPSGSMHYIKRSNSEVIKVWLCILILCCLFFSAPVVI